MHDPRGNKGQGRYEEFDGQEIIPNGTVTYTIQKWTSPDGAMIKIEEEWEFVTVIMRDFYGMMQLETKTVILRVTINVDNGERIEHRSVQTIIDVTSTSEETIQQHHDSRLSTNTAIDRGPGKRLLLVDHGAYC